VFFLLNLLKFNKIGLKFDTDLIKF
jgi:hypothetical protein